MLRSAEKNTTKGILICLVSYLFMSLIGIFEKSISHTISLPTILFFQNSICLLLLLITANRNKFNSFRTQHFNTYFIRIAAGLGCYAILFDIIRYIPISEALLYQYSGALWIPFIMFVWLNVKIPLKLWSGILVGFLGIVLILKPEVSHFTMISLLGIICGVLQGLSVVAVRKLSLTEPTPRILFYYFLAGAFATLPFTIHAWASIGLQDILFIIGVGVSTYLAQMFFTISLRYADPAALAPICYTSILYSGMIGWLFWNEIPAPMTLLGMMLVIAGCLLTLYINRPRAVLETN